MGNTKQETEESHIFLGKKRQRISPDPGGTQRKVGESAQSLLQKNAFLSYLGTGKD